MIALQKLPAAAQACIRALTNLQHLEAKLPLTPDLLVTLQPLHALTQLHLVGCLCSDNSAMIRISSDDECQPVFPGATWGVSVCATLLMTKHGSNHLAGG